jgi:hypothetical protein
MRYSVAQWSPEYGMPRDTDLVDATPRVDPGVEVPLQEWRGIVPDVDAAEDVVFVDGVRRVDANLWIDQPAARPALGLAATYAAGVVRSNGRAELVDARVERGVFTAAAGATDIVTMHGTYGIKATKGSSPEELWLGIQARMGDLEGAVAADHVGEALVIVDGPLSHRRHVPDAVGYVKREHVEYLPERVWDVKYGLAVGRRTPIFLTTSDWSRYSWHLRLAQGAGPGEGLVRCEVAADRDLPAVVRLADRVTATLPRFSSAPHKDPRAPENLYPIGGLEREMRRRLGDSHLMFRALRRAAAAVA